MPRALYLLSLTVLGVFVFSASARAQAVGVGGPRPFGVYGTVWPGYYGAYSSSWSNGFSLYGPPVPTYGSVPGAFGGADQRLSNFNYNFSNINIENGAGIGLGAPGSGGAGPRRRHWAGNDAGIPQPQAATGQANIDVRVPAADAEVLFEGTNTRQAGIRRLFQSPVLQVGTTYYYKIRAKWKQQDGTVTEQERSVGVRANETTVVDFTGPVKVNDKQPLLAAP